MESMTFETLFIGSIRENILYGKENATEVEIIEDAKAVNVVNTINIVTVQHQ